MSNDDDQVIDATGRVAFTGDQPHPYRTRTRFHKINGTWQPIESEPSDKSQRRRSTPEERKAGREQAKAKAAIERRVMAKISKAISKQQSIGDPSCRPSESEDFPLLEALRREKRNEEAIAVVLRYRKLVALCEAEPLKGLDYSKADGGEIVRLSKRLTPEDDINAAEATGWINVPNGEIKYSSKIRKSKGAYASTSKRTVVASNDNVATGSVIKTESLHVKLTDEVLNAHIDAKPILAELRASLGPLVEPFEEAVLNGRNYSDIGKRQGENSKPAVAGRTLVGMAIGSIKVSWSEIDKREKDLEAKALYRFRNRVA